MCKTVKFFVENAKNIVFLICATATIVAFCVTLYGIPPRIDKAEEDIQSIKVKQELMDVKFNSLEGSFKDIKEDIKEIRNDLKLLLQRK